MHLRVLKKKKKRKDTINYGLCFLVVSSTSAMWPAAVGWPGQGLRGTGPMTQYQVKSMELRAGS